VLASLVSENASHVLQATQVVQVGQTVSEPLQCRPLLPSVQGYKHNIGTSYIPFLIIDETGRQVPARFIKVCMTDNPYVEARLSMDGQVHRGEIHAAAFTDRVAPQPTIGPDELQLLDCEYQDWMVVDDVLATIQDRLLTAEVIRWQALQKQYKTIQESICKMED
jgi:hypothetical protein